MQKSKKYENVKDEKAVKRTFPLHLCDKDHIGYVFMAKKYKILNKQPVIAPKANYLLANKFPY